MKKILIPIATLIIGIALGIAGMTYVIQRGPNQIMANMSVGYIISQAIYGELLYEKRYDDLQRLIEKSFLGPLDFQKEMNFSPKGYISSLKIVRSYYQSTGHPVPQSIQDHINNIPKGQVSGPDLKVFADRCSKIDK